MIYFITGGERSGKSRFAQQLALEITPHPAYLATARRWDHDFEKRIERHQQERDHRWTNIEEETTIGKIETTSDVILLDCVTLWLTNIFFDQHYQVDPSLAFAKAELSKIFSGRKTWRCINFMNDLRKTNYQSVVITTHHGVLKSIHAHLHNLSLYDAMRTQFPYGSVTRELVS